MNNDLISRSVLKGLISDKSIPIKFEEEKRGNWQYSLGVILSDIYNVIDTAPKVSERPKGEWIVVKQDNEGIHEIKCPFCQYSKGSDFSSLITVTFERFPPFCESCGAELKGGTE